MIHLDILKPDFEARKWKLIIVSGGARNVGKTTFASLLIQHLNKLNCKVVALKISPHKHDDNPPFCTFSDHRFILSLEKDAHTSKDSSRFLKAGAHDSWFLQVNDNYLEDAFNYTSSFFSPDDIVVVESGALRNIINPDIHFFVMSKSSNQMKDSASEMMKLAQKIVQFDGKDFDFDTENLVLENNKLVLNDSFGR